MNDLEILETFKELDKQDIDQLQEDYNSYILGKELDRTDIMRILSYFVLKSYLLENELI